MFSWNTFHSSWPKGRVENSSIRWEPSRCLTLHYLSCSSPLTPRASPNWVIEALAPDYPGYLDAPWVLPLWRLSSVLYWYWLVLTGIDWHWPANAGSICLVGIGNTGKGGSFLCSQSLLIGGLLFPAPCLVLCPKTFPLRSPCLGVAALIVLTVYFSLDSSPGSITRS